MDNAIIKKRVNLDGIHSLDISVCEPRQTVVTELITFDDPPVMIYAEKFDEPCNYFKAGIRRGIEYLKINEKKSEKNHSKEFFEKLSKNNEPN